jgi:hypothetical protein
LLSFILVIGHAIHAKKNHSIITLRNLNIKFSKTAPQALRSCSRARQNSVQKRSVHGVREYFEPDFNAAIGQEMRA